ncbi:MAG: GNAT family N-acetyltransferase [Parcubacteria group bacterium]|nr:GNAT family N-acetyltransferase [Parcubacteria group bacterium]
MRSEKGFQNGTKRNQKEKIEIKIADSEKEIRGAFRLRYEVFIQECKLRPAENFQIPEEKNGHDEKAAHIIAVADGEVIAALRLIEVDAKTAFQGAFRYSDAFDFSQALGFSRLAIRKDYRSRYDIFPEMVIYAHRYAAERGFRFFCGIMRKKLMDLFRRKEWDFYFQSEPFRHDDHPTVAFILPISQDNLRKLKR